MFNDGRSRKVIFLAHCFLNQNAISDGTADYPTAHRPLVDFLLDHNISIFQMPCPEFICLGLDRGNIHGAESPVTVENTRIRREMQKAESDRKLDSLADYVVSQAKEYIANGFEVLARVGANRSPNCGVDTTSDDNEEIQGKGLFIDKLSNRFEESNISIPFIGLKAADDFSIKFNTIVSKD